VTRTSSTADVPFAALLAAAALLLSLVAGLPVASADEIDDAVRSGNADGVRAALAALPAADLNRPARDGLTPLLRAVQAANVPIAELLLAAGADANAANRYGISPLWLAATNRNSALIELLLGHGADASAALPHGETALMAAARAGDPESVRLLAAAGADPNAAEQTLGETALIWAAAENHADAIRALVEQGADPNLPSRVLDLAPMDWVQVGMVSTVLPVGGWPPLLFAARENAQDAALALIGQGAEPDARDPEGNTALLIALANDHFDMAAVLLDSGADPDVADRAGTTALFAAIDRASAAPDFGRPPVPRFNRQTARDLARLAIEHGADVDAQLRGPTLARHHGFPDRSLANGGTALMRAARSADLESARLLLDAGANIDVRMGDGATVMHVAAGARLPPGAAAEADARELLDLLLAAGGDVESSADDGQTPIHRAARSGNAIWIELLVEYGARLDVADAAGMTPLDIVTAPGRGNNPEIAALIARIAAAAVPVTSGQRRGAP